MNTKKIIVLSALAIGLFMFSGFKTETIHDNTVDVYDLQDGLIVYASYNGYAEGGYNFVTKGKDGKPHVLTFQEAKPNVLKSFDLKSDKLVGTFFKITFHKDDKFSKEKHDDVNTITALEKH
ncbi:hypothetical protein VOI54_07220 [Tamlana sp. 2201CG12-4]|uniref:hypothetical protein n=1 Tax=Tamlana sp. 2201CG12-4 TaxID=3112582 RepID=UPI002DBDA5B8|nr:hypothetical protein [Tamlana sp. 2201CG12-4]MEC3906804.1 hypothetical protein [Tamlana sp. 2201CG12-4]